MARQIGVIHLTALEASVEKVGLFMLQHYAIMDHGRADSKESSLRCPLMLTKKTAVKTHGETR